MPIVLREPFTTYDKLKDGIRRAQAVGFLSIFFSIAAMFGSVFILHQRNDLARMVMKVLHISMEKCGEMKQDYILSAVINTGSAGYALSVASVLTAVVLLIAIQKRIYKLMIPWLAFNGLMIGCCVYFCVYLLCLAFVGPIRMYLTCFVTMLLLIVCYIHMFKVVCCLYKLLERIDQHNEQVGEIELAEYSNTDEETESVKSATNVYLPGRTHALAPLATTPTTAATRIPFVV